MKKKYPIFLAIVAVLAFVLITFGVTYAFFSYIAKGETENTIRAGSITFHYDEVTKKGRGISLVDALPVAEADETGAFLTNTDERNVFNFKITADTGSTIEMPYYITARVKEDSTLDASLVRIYLTQVNGANETAVLPPTTFSTLSQYTPIDANRFVEKVLYSETIPTGTTGYEQDYRLRMWLGEAANYSEVPASCSVTLAEGVELTQANCEAASGVWTAAYYPLNDKTFTVTVNVYSTGEVNTSGSTTTGYNANQVEYYNSASTQCSNNQTVECALDELHSLLG